jgi:PKD repeat protein
LQAAGGNNPPTAGFTFNSTDLIVSFTDASSDSDGTIATWAWDFGDDSNSSAPSPSHTYGAAGSYTVALTVTDNVGGIDSTSQLVTVSAGGGSAAPVANFSYVCSGRDCDFTSSATADAGISTLSWDFGDGSELMYDEPSPSHSYSANGNYTVTLTVTDAQSASDSASASFRVKNRGNTSGSTGGDGGGDTGSDPGGSEKGRKKCSDEIDNDGDGLIDLADPDCQ